MPYELILRLKSTEPVCVSTLHNKLRSAGLRMHPGSLLHGMFASGLAFLEIIADTDVPAGLGVLVRIPCGYNFIEVHMELLNLERVARLIGADVLDGDKVIHHNGTACIFAFHDRYERASGLVREGLEVA